MPMNRTGGAGHRVGWMRATNRSLPDQVETRDLVLISIATHKMARMLSKDRVGSTIRAPFTTFQGDAGHGEVDEAARGRPQAGDR
jgi:Protein of unknown function (DUF1360)